MEIFTMRNWMLGLAFATLTLPNLFFGQQYNIRGFVSDQKTGEAISDQKVTLLSIDSSLVAGAMTDPNGLFTIPKLEKGNYILRLKISGYMKTFINVTLQGDKKMYDLSITLSPTEKEFGEVTVTAESKTKKTK
ncbi:MAG: carboxypeptidase regulatory-like domain-containing protein, partial [Flavobacteriia bacterium]|nr:carboxypeptidase regulatory-like domain-containing protein [Flavobacteriia bacterium]